MKIRCSMLPKLMTGGAGKTWKSEIRKIAYQDYFGYETELSNKYLTKGIVCEEYSIDLYNGVFQTNLVKNEIRLENEWLTGCCDLISDSKIIDIKTSWSLETFPALREEINIKDYEMQLRGYMMLYDVNEAEIAYCMVNTPIFLLSDWDNINIHQVDFIDKRLLVTTSEIIKRDLEIEAQIITRCNEALEYYKQIINQLHEKNH